MSLEEATKILETRLETIWVDTDNIDWDNVEFRTRHGQSFLRVSLDQIGSRFISLQCTRDTYLLSIQVLVPSEIGSKLCNQYSDTLLLGFKNFNSGYLRCLEGISRRVGEEREWYQRNVDIEVEYDNYS